MTELMTLELHYPSNWAYEGEVDVLYCDPNNGAETSYGRLSQGQVMVRETYPGHRWVVRESTSRELLMNIVASRPGAGPHTVTIGSDGGLDPLKAAIWRMGRAPREVLLKANGVLRPPSLLGHCEPIAAAQLPAPRPMMRACRQPLPPPPSPPSRPHPMVTIDDCKPWPLPPRRRLRWRSYSALPSIAIVVAP